MAGLRSTDVQEMLQFNPWHLPPTYTLRVQYGDSQHLDGAAAKTDAARIDLTIEQADPSLFTLGL